jgi:BirA family biotin operon repressor/biotin-[acetyl-CoA-carboxylase] ligase
MDRDSSRQRLCVRSLRDELTGPGRSWRRLDVVEETGSTNADLLARAAAGEDIDGVVLMADSQTAARGRHGRSWSTPPRSQVALSAGLVVGAVPNEAWGWLPLLTGVAVVDAVAEVAGVEAGLKWPNDVLVGTGKLAGILAEVAAPEPVVVVGLGLNVTEAPDPVATSLAMLGARVDRTELAEAVLRHLAARIGSWRAAQGADAALAADYRSRSATIGSRVRASLPGDKAVEGVAIDIDELGRLRIDTGEPRTRGAGQGGVVTVSAGDITHLRLANP